MIPCLAIFFIFKPCIIKLLSIEKSRNVPTQDHLVLSFEEVVGASTKDRIKWFFIV
jgi:hypothetical protein